MRAHAKTLRLLLILATVAPLPIVTSEGATVVEGRLDPGVGLAGLGGGHRYAVPVELGQVVHALATWDDPDASLAVSANGPTVDCTETRFLRCMGAGAEDAVGHLAASTTCDPGPQEETYEALRAGNVELIVWLTHATEPVEYALTITVDGAAASHVSGPANAWTSDLAPACHV